MQVDSPISVGELLDKQSIVEIKISKIVNPEKLEYLNSEYKLLESKSKEIKSMDEKKFNEFYNALLDVNSKLWKIEDDIRDCESKKNFDKVFIELARSVYITNDLRFEIKSKINNHFGSSIVEQKELKNY
jgi:hypothetical protein|tara:strand:- start:1046 stop:1435 length:390 start_codon:yes stop_codon:yes gene_type:complete